MLGSAFGLASFAAIGCGSDDVTRPTSYAGSTSTSGNGGSTSGGGGSGGTGGGAAACSPEGPFDGEPVTGEAGEWVWVDVPEARCRNGSATGFGVRINPASDKLFIYLEGGGACFNGASCAVNPSSYAKGNFDGWKVGGGQQGIFDPANPDNAVRDWSAVYIPYCTGDVHGGNAEGVDVPGFGAPQDQAFVGYSNIGHYLKRIIPTFPGVSQVLLTGISAGGFGASYNYDRIAQAFCPSPVVLIDDSGPPMADEYLAPCLQKRWRDLWGFDDTLPKDCADCALPDGGGSVNYSSYIARKYPASRLGLISSDKDSTIAMFFGFGQNDCANLDNLAAPMSGDEYRAGLLDVRDNHLSASPVWATYFVSSTSHTYLGGNAYYSTDVEGTKLSAWVAAMVGDGQAGHVGP